jgi:hypothetical protein
MKIAIVCALVIASVSTASAQYLYGQRTGGTGLNGTGSNPSSHYVSPHVTSQGTYVPGHQQTNPNSTQLDNYGTRGNLNSHTGTIGTRGARY